MTISAPSQTLIPLDFPGEWNRALEGIPHGFAHTWENCYAMHLTTGYSTFLYCFERNGTRIVCPIAERPCGGYQELVTPYGISGFSGTGDVADFPSLWEEFARSRGYVTAYITLNPIFDRPGFTNSGLTHQHNTLYFLDLAIGQDRLFLGFDESRRRGLRRWEESGVSIVADREALRIFFLDNYQEFFRRIGTSKVYEFVESTVAFLLASEQVYVIGAESAGQLQSVLVCGSTQYSSDFLFSVSLPEGRHHGAGLLWHAARHFQRLGIPMLNLGGGVKPNDNVAEFKRRFGASPMPLRSLRLVIQPVIYNQLCIRAGVSATDRSGFFPPYQRPFAVAS